MFAFNIIVNKWTKTKEVKHSLSRASVPDQKNTNQTSGTIKNTTVECS